MKNIVLTMAVVLTACPAARADEEYHINYMMYPEGTPGVNRMCSKHFCVVYGDRDKKGLWSKEMAEGTLRNLEALWEVYVEKLKWTPPVECRDPKSRRYNDGRKYKVNLVVLMTGLPQHDAGGGAWMGSHEGFAYLMADSAYLRVSPPSWATPHEFGHVMEMHQKGGFNNNPWSGCWWETYANWLRERYLYDPAYPKAPETDFCWPYLETWQMVWPHGRNYYHCWMFLHYLEENPDNLPLLGSGFNRRIWNESLQNEYPVHTMIRLSSPETFKKALGHFAARMATLDLSQQRIYLERFNRELDDYRRRTLYTELKRVPDRPGWWRCPAEHAPQQMGINVVRLVGESAEVKVTFAGLADESRGADWRVALVAVDRHGKARYSTLWNAGSNSLPLRPDDSAVYLTVAATPDRFEPVNLNSATGEPYESHPGRQRFPYELRMEGARPLESRPAPPAGTKGRRHPNGGGFVAETAKVDAGAYVGPDALVLGRARVLGTARVEDFAVVRDDATVQDRATVSGNAVVCGRAVVRDEARVCDWGWVGDGAVIRDRGVVMEHGVVSGRDALVADCGIVKGCSAVYGKVIGTGMADGDFNTGSTVTRGVAFGWWWGTPREAQAYADNRPWAGCLYAAYDFDRADAWRARDRFGVTHGILRNGPQWVDSLDGRRGVLTFNGVDQYVLLEDSLTNFVEMEIRCFVRRGGAGRGPVWFFGAAPEQCMYLTPANSAGNLAFVIRKAGRTEMLEAPGPLPVGTWRHVRVAIGAGRGALYVDGRRAAEGRISLRPLDIRPTGSSTAAHCNYIARGETDGERFFAGAIDNFEVYAAAMDAGPMVFGFEPEKVSHDAAVFRGILAHAGNGSTATVRIHWGTTDGGTDPNAWQNTATLESHSPGPVSLNAGPLKPDTTYCYRLSATDGSLTGWSPRTISLRTRDVLEIDPGSVQWPALDSAWFHTRLPYSAGGKAEVRFYWGTTDGGTDPAAWQNVLSAGQHAPGDRTIEARCTGLRPGADYYMRAFAVSAAGQKWASRSVRFRTPAAPAGSGSERGR